MQDEDWLGHPELEALGLGLCIHFPFPGEKLDQPQPLKSEIIKYRVGIVEDGMSGGFFLPLLHLFPQFPQEKFLPFFHVP